MIIITSIIIINTCHYMLNPVCTFCHTSKGSFHICHRNARPNAVMRPLANLLVGLPVLMESAVRTVRLVWVLFMAWLVKLFHCVDLKLILMEFPLEEFGYETMPLKPSWCELLHQEGFFSMVITIYVHQLIRI